MGEKCGRVKALDLRWVKTDGAETEYRAGMTDPFLFLAAVLALLAVPGPTNTLLAASGATVGLARSLRLIPAELAAYALSIGALIAALGPLMARYPLLSAAAQLGVAAYLLAAAVRFWSCGASGERGAVSVRRVFATTLINPKGLIFALAVFPHEDLPRAFALFAAVCVPVALGWIALGQGAARLGGTLATPRRVYRITAVGHVVFAGIVANGALHAFS